MHAEGQRFESVILHPERTLTTWKQTQSERVTNNTSKTDTIDEQQKFEESKAKVVRQRLILDRKRKGEKGT